MKRLKSGHIIEVHIKEIDKYVYLKYIDVRDFIKDVSYPFQFRVHNSFSDESLMSASGLNFSQLLISPLHLTGFKELLKSGDWNIIGSQTITNDDTLQHHYKMGWPPNLLAIFENVKQWRVLQDINNVNAGDIVPYYRCAHLEYAENLGAGNLALRVCVEYYKGKKVKENLEKIKWSKFEKALFSRYINMPLYTEVPDKFKGKLLPENFSDKPYWLDNIEQIKNNIFC